MDRIFLIISAVGISYLAYLIFAAMGKKNEKDPIIKQMNLMAVQGKFESEKLQKLLNNAGLQVSSRKINLFRFSAAALYVTVQALSNFIRNEPFSFMDVFIGVGILVVSSHAKFLPFGWILNRLHRNKIMRKDGELISFLRLYENNRLRRRGYIEFGTYCSQVAPTFEYLRNELYGMSERCVDIGTENAIKWFCDQFPHNHVFISDIRSILLATEGMSDDNEAAHYLSSQSKIISKISSDQYQRKWIRIGEYSTIVTTLPSIATFLMVVVLAMKYIMLIKGNFNGVSLYQ
ncbi:hypothetical protein JI735_33920 (plasmid) [Paenibacillus sonchi]|uniref:Uncharacterized protein n=1 Tax=Paenibacillus sonchi TaxID=373687 RepID=A0A974SFI4_9BACL|nr:hypothetical protein [Paenibacillus sonchi]QQZ64648.1 hypothetical protein JI735_33920 [Paenibacillus sonchi]